MSKPKKLEVQLAEINHSIANYQKQLTIIQVEIFKLELKKEKLMDSVFLQSVKSQIAKRKNSTMDNL